MSEVSNKPEAVSLPKDSPIDDESSPTAAASPSSPESNLLIVSEAAPSSENRVTRTQSELATEITKNQDEGAFGVAISDSSEIEEQVISYIAIYYRH